MNNLNLGRLGGQLGIGLCLLGFLVIFFGWNGAASQDYLPAQLPYLISGGAVGLGIVVIGASLVIVQNHRADRARHEPQHGTARGRSEHIGGGRQPPSTSTGLLPEWVDAREHRLASS